MSSGFRKALFVGVLLASFFQLVLGFAAAEDLQAGVATVDITPPTGYRMSGYFNERLGTGVHDPLHAKAIVLRQGDREAALVFCDLIGLSLRVSCRARELAQQKTGIPAANILIAATHTHTGPLYFGALRDHFHDAAVAKHGGDPCETTDFPSTLVEKLAQVIAEAQQAAQPVALQAGSAQQTGVSFNRRFHMKDGSVRFNPGVLNPDIVRPAGPIDPQMGVIMVRDVAAGKTTAALINFALHLDTVGGTLYGADYPFHIERSLRETLGEEFVLLFGNGTCGDINHIDVSTRERLKTEFIGETLAKAILAELPNLKPLGSLSLAVRSTTVNAPLQQYSPEQVAKARKDMFKVGTPELSFLEQVEAYKIMAVHSRRGSTIPLEVQVFRLSNDVAIVGLPGEVFVDLGLAIKKKSPFATTLVIELCNDAPGYIPTERAFAEGSYETVNSRIQSGGGEMLVEAAVRLLNELGKEVEHAR